MRKPMLPSSRLTLSSGASPGLAENRSQYPMTPSTIVPLIGSEVRAKEAAPALLEHSPLGFFQGIEGIAGVTNGIAGCRTQLCQPIGQAFFLLDQDEPASERRISHATEDALQLSAVPAIGIRTKFLRQTRNILTEFVQEFPLASRAPLDYRQWQLICAKEWSQSGAVTCREL